MRILRHGRLPFAVLLCQGFGGFGGSLQDVVDALLAQQGGRNDAVVVLGRKLQNVGQITDAELSIFQVLCDRGAATAREIASALYEEVTDPKMASVQKLLERPETKGCVQRDRSERAHRFRPRMTREDFLRSRLQAPADRLCDVALARLKP
jgi:BlaI family penicillinase repressor